MTDIYIQYLMRAGIADYTRTLCPAWSAVCGSALIQVRARAGIQPGWAGIAGDKPGAALAVVASLDVDAGPVNARNKNVGKSESCMVYQSRII